MSTLQGGAGNIITDGLVLHLDAGNYKSYSSGSTNWQDLSITNNSGSLTNGPSFENNNGGVISFDGVNDYISIPETNLTNWSVSTWFRYDYTANNQTILNLLDSSTNKSGDISWVRSPFYDISSLSVDTTGSIYFGTFGNGIWDGSIARWFGVKLDSTGSIISDFNQNYFVGNAVTQQQTYVGNDEFLYTCGTNLNFFAKRNKQTGELISEPSAGASTVSTYFIIDESERKVYHMGGVYTTAFGLSRTYLCKFDLDTYAVDTVFNTSASLNSAPNGGQIFLTSDKFLYAFGSNITSYKGTPINHVIRINQSASLDSNFNPGSGFNDSREIICAIDSQNKLVCYGRYFTSYSGSSSNNIVRINTNGTRDTAFTSYGLSAGGAPYSINIQSDGKILLTGNFTLYSGSASRGIVRLNPDGTLDSTFSIGSGISTINLGHKAYIQPDGKILLTNAYPYVTNSFNGTNFKTFIRLTNSGSVDPGFNTGSGFTDTTTRSEINTRIRNTSGTLTTVTNFGAWPSVGNRNAPEFFESRFNRWQNITYTKDSNNDLRLYVDSVLVQTTSYSTASYQNLDLQIDRLVTSNNKVANIMIYNKVLSASEILQNYNSSKKRFGL